MMILLNWKKIGILLLIGIGHPAFWAQDDCGQGMSAKAKKLYEKGSNKDKYTSDERVEWLEKSIDEDPECLPCQIALAELLFSRFRRFGEGADAVRSHATDVISHCPDGHPKMHYILGALAYAERNWTDAQRAFNRFLTSLPRDPSRSLQRQAEEVREVLPTIAFEAAFWADADAFVPTVVQGVNTQADEFLPALSPDGSMLFFTRRSPHKAKGDVITRDIELFEVAKRLSTPLHFSASDVLPSPFNEGAQYGGASISLDNRELWIAASNPTSGNPNNVDLFVTNYEVIEIGHDHTPVYQWGTLKPALALNTPDGWEAQPALSADGQRLYFAQINAHSTPDKNGNPTMDLMVSHRDQAGIWSTPESLPPPINTAYNEKSPFLHPDGKTLFFASDRVPGGGGYDLWMTHLDTQGTWSSPVNIGAPVNTEQDEHGMVVDIDGQTAFFAGRRTGTKGLDILSFPLSDRFQPEAVLLIQGAVLTPEGMPALNAKVTLENLGSSGERKELQVREDDGRFATIIARPDIEEAWVLSTEGDGIAFDAIEVKAPVGEAVAKADLQARALVLNAPLEMRNIEFPTDQSTLDASAKVILKAFAGYLTRQPQYHVRLEGHTDNTGLPDQNVILSQDRAHAARQFLIEQGIEPMRIGAQGHGDQKPIASNDSEAGRAANRRTEFVIFVP